MGDALFRRIDKNADYGSLNGLASKRSGSIAQNESHAMLPFNGDLPSPEAWG
jgi:hypothetical protein